MAERSETTIRVAAAGDVHCREGNREEVARAFASLRGEADVVLLAGDLTAVGEPAEARVLAEACAPLEIPVLAVLGNHDWHANRTEELTGVLTEAGIDVLDRDSRVIDLGGVEVGVIGTKGFVGGFAGSHLSDFGEPALRMIYADATAEVKALARGLQQVATCPVRIVLLHYAPTEQTLEGESPGIWTYLGTDRLAGPIREHEPDMVLHGHAHAGTLQGKIDGVPVYNVSIPLMGRDFWIFELEATRAASPRTH
jgi:Icc-related predicted phosphoesterase